MQSFRQFILDGFATVFSNFTQLLGMFVYVSILITLPASPAQSTPMHSTVVYVLNNPFAIDVKFRENKMCFINYLDLIFVLFHSTCDVFSIRCNICNYSTVNKSTNEFRIDTHVRLLIFQKNCTFMDLLGTAHLLILSHMWEKSGIFFIFLTVFFTIIVFLPQFSRLIK